MEVKTVKPLKMPNIVQRFLAEVVLPQNKKFVIKSKSNPTGLYKALAPILRIFNPDIDNYITVLFDECWVPSNFFLSPTVEILMTLAHETVHEHDRKKYGNVAFSLMYLFPQVLALGAFLSLLAIWFGPWWLLALGFLLFLLPLPSPTRTKLEVRGYQVTMMILEKAYGYSREKLAGEAERISREFTGPAYYFMWPFKKNIQERLLDTSSHSEIVYVEILNFFYNEGLIRPAPLLMPQFEIPLFLREEIAQPLSVEDFEEDND